MTVNKNDRRAVVLASASPTRAALLTDAGLHITVAPARVDENEIKDAMKATGADAGAAAEALAELKARRVSVEHPKALVIGADQILDCAGEWFDKPRDGAAARTNLMTLRGRPHRLVTSVVVVENDNRLWHHTDSAELVMRDFSDAFLDDYIEAAGDDLRATVGGYRLEGLGSQLFASVQGDFFTILGLPLLPLLDFLRTQGVIAP